MLRDAITSLTQTASFGAGTAPIQYLHHVHRFGRLERLLPCQVSLDPAAKASDVRPPIGAAATFVFVHLRGVDAITTSSLRARRKGDSVGREENALLEGTRVRG
jgi:hypothetical protein